MYKPFTPFTAGTKQISATGTTGNVALAMDSTYLEVSNDGPDTVFVELGGSTVTAAANTGYPVLPGQSKLIMRSSATYAAAICASGKTATVYFSAGDGV